MRKIVVNSGVVCVSLFITLMLIFSLNFLYKVELLEVISNQLIPEGALVFRTSCNTINFEELYKALPDDTILINNLAWDSNIKSVIFKGQNYELPLLDGRNFSIEDIDNGRNVVIIGRELLEESKQFHYKNDVYDVVGIIGCEFESEADKVCIMLMKDELINPEGNFYIYGEDSDEIISFLGNESIWDEVVLLDNDALGITEAVNLKERMGVLPILVMLVCLAFNHIFWKKWVNDKANEIAIRKELGFDDPKTYLFIFFRAVVLIIIGMLIAVAFNYNIKINLLVQSFMISGIVLTIQPAVILLMDYWRGRNAD